MQTLMFPFSSSFMSMWTITFCFSLFLGMTMFNERPNFFFSLLPLLLLGEVGGKKIRGELCINIVGLALNHRCNGGSVSQNFELWPLFTIWRFPGFKGRPGFKIGFYEVLTLDIFQVLCLSLLLPKQFQVSKKRMKSWRQKLPKSQVCPYPSIHPARAFCPTKSWIPTVLITNVIVVIICVFVAVVISWSSSWVNSS